MLPEILHIVFSKLSVVTLVRVNLVCKTWHAVAIGNLWRDPFYKSYADASHMKTKILPFIGKYLVHIQSLSLAYARWDVVEAIARLPVTVFPAVTRLDLSSTTLDDELLIALLQKTPNLRFLDLNYSENLSEACIRQIQQLAHLDTLSVDNDVHIWPSKIRRLKWGCETYGVNQIQATLQSILDCCPLLTELVLQELKVMDPNWLEQFLAKKHNLRRLALISCDLDGSILQRVAATSLQYLTRFEVSDCAYIKNVDVMAVLKLCPHITSLTIMLMESPALDSLPLQVLGRLQELRVSYAELSEASMHAVLDHCCSLRCLYLTSLSKSMKILGERKPTGWAFSETLRELYVEKLYFSKYGLSTEEATPIFFQNVSRLTCLWALTIGDSDIMFNAHLGMMRPLESLTQLRLLGLFGLRDRLQFQVIQWITTTYHMLEELACVEAANIHLQSWMALHHPDVLFSYPNARWKFKQTKGPLTFEG
ncbi:hypothetical protein BGZ73_005505 [Actinomortierella ambigua]|nr:hypothetical protein BGZ73_005505 [Actinomortierella ambigua]